MRLRHLGPCGCDVPPLPELVEVVAAAIGWASSRVPARGAQMMAWIHRYAGELAAEPRQPTLV